MRASSARIARGAFAIAATALSLAAQTPASGQFFLYAGTSTNRGSSKGIYVYRFDSTNGNTEPLGLAAESPNPTFLAVHPNHRFLYAVSEVSNYAAAGAPAGSRAGSVAAVSIDSKSARLTDLNAVSSNVSGPTRL